MRPLSRRLAALAAGAAARPRLLLVLDYDGTLVPTRARPGLARLGAPLRRDLRRLRRAGADLALMSGRSVANLKTRVPLAGIGYGGVFGLELEWPDWRWLHPRARRLRPALIGLAGVLEDLYRDLPGVQIEDKGAGLTLHYRNVPAPRRAEFARRLGRARTLAPRGLAWRKGKRAWEIAPRSEWNKGDAVLRIWRRLGRPYVLTVGDDVYDEPMFRAARGRGAGLKVGRGPTSAAYRLENAGRVADFLRVLADRVSARPGRAR